MSARTAAMFEDLIRFVDRFVKLSDADLVYLRGHLQFHEYPRKHILVREGEVEQQLYFVSRGLIHQYFYNGKEQVTTDLVAEGTITGSVASFLSGHPSHYFLETLEPSALITISRNQLEELYASDLKWQRFGRILITHFLLQQERHILSNMQYTVRERITHFAAEFPELLGRVPQRKLASYLDIKPETFSRIKSQMAGGKGKSNSA